jgi:hypothetical protein
MDVQRGDEAAAALKKANPINQPPAEGMQYLLVTVKATNTGDDSKAQDPAIVLDVRPTGDHNTLYSRALAVPPKPFSGSLLPKGSAEGQFVFLVPANEKNLMARVAELLTFDESAYRYVALDEGAKVTPPADMMDMASSDMGKTKDAPAKIGEPVTIEGMQVIVLEVIRGADAAAKIKAANPINQPAPAGQEYVLLHVHVHALAQDAPDKTVKADVTLFKLSGEKSIEYDLPLVVAPEPRLDATLYPGGETEGWIGLSAGEGEKGLVVKVAPLISFSPDAARYVAIP